MDVNLQYTYKINKMIFDLGCGSDYSHYNLRHLVFGHIAVLRMFNNKWLEEPSSRAKLVEK